MGSKDLQPIPDSQVPVTLEFVLQREAALQEERDALLCEIKANGVNLDGLQPRLTSIYTVLRMCSDGPLAVPINVRTALDLPEGMFRPYKRSLNELRQIIGSQGDTKHGRYIAGGSLVVSGILYYFFPSLSPAGALVALIGGVVGGLVGIASDARRDLLKELAENPAKKEQCYEKVKGVQEHLGELVRSFEDRKKWIMEPGADLVPVALAVDSLLAKLRGYSKGIDEVLDPAFGQNLERYAHYWNKRGDALKRLSDVERELKKYQPGEKKKS